MNVSVPNFSSKNLRYIILFTNFLVIVIGIGLCFLKSQRENGIFMITNTLMVLFTAAVLYNIPTKDYPTLKEALSLILTTVVVPLALLPAYANVKGIKLDFEHLFRGIISVCFDIIISYTMFKLFNIGIESRYKLEALTVFGFVNLITLLSLGSYLRDVYVFYESQEEDKRRDVAVPLVITLFLGLSLLISNVMKGGQEDLPTKRITLGIVFSVAVLQAIGVQTKYIDPYSKRAEGNNAAQTAIIIIFSVMLGLVIFGMCIIIMKDIHEKYDSIRKTQQQFIMQYPYMYPQTASPPSMPIDIQEGTPAS